MRGTMWRVILTASACGALVGCTSSAPRTGQRVSCHCSYLTDYDDTAKVDVEVCVPTGRDTTKEASVCAMQSAHNHIDRCDCQAASGPCDPSATGACVNR